VKGKDPKRFGTNNVALFLLLEDLSTSSMICIGNAHLYWDPKFTDVKIMQAYMIADELHKFADSETSQVILCGDFNSEPNSGVYHYLSTGKLVKNNPDRQKFVPKFNFKLSKPFSSAYSPLNDPITNFTASFTGCLDYIWYLEESLEVVEVLDKMSENSAAFEKYKTLPNPNQPSDHVCLMAKFVSKQKAD